MDGLEQLLERVVSGLGFELADFEIFSKNKILRVFIDKSHESSSSGSQQPSVTVGDCEAVTRHLQRVLEVEGIQYNRLEVSSPGLDRRLKKPSDFKRFLGREADVRLRRLINGRRRFVGIVREVSGDGVELEVEGGRFRFELSDLDRARLVPRF